MTTKIVISNKSDTNFDGGHAVEIFMRNRDPDNKTEVRYFLPPGNEVDLSVWNDNEVIIRESTHVVKN